MKKWHFAKFVVMLKRSTSVQSVPYFSKYLTFSMLFSDYVPWMFNKYWNEWNPSPIFLIIFCVVMEKLVRLTYKKSFT